MNATPTLYLASTSPRRREILAALGLDFSVVAVQTDETAKAGESPEDMVLRLARTKADAADCAGLVLGADTVVVLDDRILGKPIDAADAVSMLTALGGRKHRVLTGVALKTRTATTAALSETEVRFREIGRDEAERYWQSGEPRDKAGGYGIQGVGGIFVESISGSYSGVMGLPVFETVKLLASAGVDVLVNEK